MLYSASSAVAELRYHVAPYYFVVRQIGWAVVSFLVLMYFKRMDYRRLNTPAWAFSGLGIVLGLLVLVYFADPRTHRWFKLAGRRIVSAVRVRQARADFISGVFHRAARARYQRSAHAAAGAGRGGDAGLHGGGGGSGHGAGAGDHGGHRVLGRGPRSANTCCASALIGAGAGGGGHRFARLSAGAHDRLRRSGLHARSK